MLGTVNQATDDGRWQLRATDTTEVAKCADVDGLEFSHGRINTIGEILEYARHVAYSKWSAFQRDRCELLGRQSLPARVGEQPVDHAGHVANMERR